MKILLAGGTGFLGTRLLRELRRYEHDVTVLTRQGNTAAMWNDGGVVYARWNGVDPGPLSPLVEKSDAIVNLAGESVAKGRWTDSRKRVLEASRVGTTNAIVDAIAASGKKPRVLVNASAVGYYGNVPEGIVTESTPSSGQGFLPGLCVRWEEAAKRAEASGVRVVVTRTGIVMGGEGSALGKMALPFRFFVGGPIGSGRQWFPWVHADDVTGAIRHAIGNEGIHGPVNVTAPEPVRMKDFCSALGRALGRPSWAPVPGFVVRIAIGELAEMVLGGQQAVPRALTASGYRFLHPDLDETLRSALAEP